MRNGANDGAPRSAPQACGVERGGCVHIQPAHDCGKGNRPHYSRRTSVACAPIRPAPFSATLTGAIAGEEDTGVL